MSETGSCSRWAYEGEVEQWAKEQVERELAEMTVSLEQLAGLEEKEEEESGSSVHGSETCLREYQSLEYCSSKVRVLSLSCSGGGERGRGVWWEG